MLADVLACFGSDTGLQWADLTARLASRFPQRWEGVTADAISAECTGRDVPSANVCAGGRQARGCRKADVQAVAGAQ